MEVDMIPDAMKAALGGALLAMLLLIAGCESDQGPAESAGEQVDEAVEETRESVEDAVESTGDAIEDAADELEEDTD
jgi:hypothetical protein